MKWAGHVDRVGKMRNVYTKSEEKRPLEKTRLRWNYDIKMNVREIGW
jgi:hypothetical protein